MNRSGNEPTTPDDFEIGEVWLENLARLNTVIADAGEPLVGNLFYDHLQESFIDSPPNPILRPKRDRFRQAVDGRARLLEVGVNGGHSAYLALTSNLMLEFHGVDIFEHAYVRPAVRWLETQFPGRVFVYEGDCREVLPMLKEKGMSFDAFHIDGAKHTYFEDVCNCQRMMRGEGALVVVDDIQMEQVQRTWNRCIRQGRITHLEDFPPMAEAMKYRNAIGSLQPERKLGRPLTSASIAIFSLSERIRSVQALSAIRRRLSQILHGA